MCIQFSSLLAQEIKTDEEAIRETLLNYLNGRNNSKMDLLKKAFHPKSDLRYVKNDTLNIWPAEDYISGANSGYIHDCESRIVFIDVDGDAAQAKIEIEYPQFKFADYINLLKIEDEWQIAVKSFSRIPVKSKRVLFVLTSHEEMGNTGRWTGFHLGEVSHVYKPIHDAGYEIDFVSPKGGQTKMYGANMNDSLSVWMIRNPAAYYKLTNAMTPDQIDPLKYAAIYYVGGHGTMWDLPDHKRLGEITKEIYQGGGVVSAVCHGPSGLLNIKLDNGNLLIQGKKLTSYTDEEERASQQDKVVPFMLEAELRKQGVIYIGAKNWQENVVVDGRVITGQNPASAYKLAKEILKILNRDDK
jgi:putative intracellular protease/amidase